jgi:hypothetical protein
VTETKSLYEKMAEVGREVAYVQKLGKNQGVGYKYASAEHVLGKVNEALFSRGIAVNTDVVLERMDVYPEVTDKAGKPLQVATVRIRASFEDGSVTPDGAAHTIRGSGIGSGGDYGDKAVMKAFTAAHKYLYAGLFCISWGDDPEADSKMDADVGEAKKPAKGGKPETATTSDNPGDAKLEALAAEMQRTKLDGLDPKDYAATTEGWKQRIVACKPSASNGAYTAAVKTFKALTKEKTDG